MLITIYFITFLISIISTIVGLFLIEYVNNEYVGNILFVISTLLLSATLCVLSLEFIFYKFT